MVSRFLSFENAINVTGCAPKLVNDVGSVGDQSAASNKGSEWVDRQMGLVMNIVLGIIGAAVASWLFGFLGITFGGWIGYLIAGFIGACILIAIVRAFSGGLQQRT
jgi:uncharacterized membrane protein YeaQ/YmgE (transglycosylase-associated protein family)